MYEGVICQIFDGKKMKIFVDLTIGIFIEKRYAILNSFENLTFLKLIGTPCLPQDELDILFVFINIMKKALFSHFTFLLTFA